MGSTFQFETSETLKWLKLSQVNQGSAFSEKKISVGLTFIIFNSYIRFHKAIKTFLACCLSDENYLFYYLC
jgi:hypothetical protein